MPEPASPSPRAESPSLTSDAYEEMELSAKELPRVEWTQEACTELIKYATYMRERGEYHAAVSQLLGPAKLGHTRSQVMLADIYLNDLKHFNKAHEYATMAKKDPKARHILGILLLRGIGKGDVKEALNHLTVGAQSDKDATAVYRLAKLYLQGTKPVPKDLKKAEELLSKAAKLGHNNGLARLGWLYQEKLQAGNEEYSSHRSYGSPTDMILKAAAANSRLGQYYLGMLYMTGGCGIDQDCTAAILWLKRAAKNGLLEALTSLKDIKDHTHDKEVKASAAYVVGRLHEQHSKVTRKELVRSTAGPAPSMTVSQARDLNAARTWYKKAVEYTGHQKAKLRLALVLARVATISHGDTLKGLIKRAITLLEELMAEDYFLASYHISALYRNEVISRSLYFELQGNDAASELMESQMDEFCLVGADKNTPLKKPSLCEECGETEENCGCDVDCHNLSVDYSWKMLRDAKSLAFLRVAAAHGYPVAQFEYAKKLIATEKKVPGAAVESPRVIKVGDHEHKHKHKHKRHKEVEPFNFSLDTVLADSIGKGPSEWCQKAAAAGYAPAQAFIGDTLTAAAEKSSLNLEQHARYRIEADRWYKAASDLELPCAMFLAGCHLLNADDAGETDPERGLELIKAAAEARHVPAQIYLSDWYYREARSDGLADPQTKFTLFDSYYWCKKALTTSHEKDVGAFIRMARMHERGPPFVPLREERISIQPLRLLYRALLAAGDAKESRAEVLLAIKKYTNRVPKKLRIATFVGAALILEKHGVAQREEGDVLVGRYADALDYWKKAEAVFDAYDFSNLLKYKQVVLWKLAAPKQRLIGLGVSNDSELLTHEEAHKAIHTFLRRYIPQMLPLGKEGSWPLTLRCAHCGDYETLEALLSFGATTAAVTEDGVDAGTVAFTMNNGKCVKLLNRAHFERTKEKDFQRFLRKRAEHCQQEKARLITEEALLHENLEEISKLDVLNMEKEKIIRLLVEMGPLKSARIAQALKPIMKQMVHVEHLYNHDKSVMRIVYNDILGGKKLHKKAKMFGQINQLIKSMEDLHRKFSARNVIKYGSILACLTRIIRYYHDHMVLVRQTKSLRHRQPLFSPPVYLFSPCVGPRLLKAEMAAVLLPTDKQQGSEEGAGEVQQEYGTHIVKVLNGVHFKGDPHAPGMEYAVDSLNRIVAGQGSAPTELLKLVRTTYVVDEDTGKNVVVRSEQGIFIASLTVVGANLQFILEQRPEYVYNKLLDSFNFTAMVFSGLLTNPQDGKPDNYMLELKVNRSEKVTGMKLVGIDNDIAFAHAVVERDGKHYCGVKNVIYFFPQMDLPLDTQFVTSFLQHTPESKIVSWLSMLGEKNTYYKQLLEDGIFTKKEFEELHLPIAFVPGTVTSIYYKLLQMHETISKNPKMTHRDLFRVISPVLAIFYQSVEKEVAKKHALHHRIIEAIAMLYSCGNDCLEDRIDCSATIHGTLKPISTLLSSETARMYDFEDLRTSSIPEEAEIFVSSIDFSAFDGVTQALILSQLPELLGIKKLVLTRCSILETNNTLFRLLSKMPSVRELHLVGCVISEADALTLLSQFPQVDLTYDDGGDSADEHAP